jgi:hypothetical protein
MTPRECASTAGWWCATARLVEVRLTEPDTRFPTHRNKLGRSHVQHWTLYALLRLTGAGLTTASELPIRADDPIRNT